jgi:hypothetical protein
MRASIARCGRCGQPRGLIHECTARRKGPAWQLGLTFSCGTCGKTYKGSPFGHECAISSDYRKRLAARKRQEKAEERRRKRKRASALRRSRARVRRRNAAEKRKQAARDQQKAPRPASHDRDRHDYQACADLDCPRHPCKVFRQGVAIGIARGESAGFANGYAAAMTERTG